MLQRFFNSLWYESRFLPWLLWPLSLGFRCLVKLRRMAYQFGLLKTTRFPIPVIVVGNLTVGGTGKTPLVLYLAKQLQQRGFKPGIVSRGYGGKLNSHVVLVNAQHQAHEVGDEVMMLARHCHCPLVIAKKRTAAVEFLVNHTDCNVVLSDDGLQHYALDRDIEIIVIDGNRRFGNGMCLPAGPLRESSRRLKTVDFVVCNSDPKNTEYGMHLLPHKFINVKHPEHQQPIDFFNHKFCYAIAGIANPSRFFKTLTDLGCEFISQSFPDHHTFQASDFSFAGEEIVMMTEKDSVKCQAFATEKFWYLSVSVELDEKFIKSVIDKLYRVCHSSESWNPGI